MGHLVAIDLPARAAADALRSIWDAGDTALVVDRRLPPPARSRLLAALAPAALADEFTGPTGEDDALVVATSGTTGDPRGAVLTHHAVEAHARAVHARLGVDPAADRWLACLPLAHIGGLGVVTRALVTSTPITIHDRFDPDAVAGASHGRERCTLVSLVTTALGRTDTDAYRWVVLGGSADPVDRPANVVHTYGLTESGGGVVYGGAPLDGVDVRIVEGEIQLRGPMLLRAYRDGTDPKDADGWFPTGDLGRISDAGSVEVEGRRSELIVTGGENVWPQAVEAALATHPGVVDVAIGRHPDEEWGHRVVAFVVPRSSADPPTLAELRAHAKLTLPAFAAPRQLVLVDAVPRTTLGKVRRRDLPDMGGESTSNRR